MSKQLRRLFQTNYAFVDLPFQVCLQRIRPGSEKHTTNRLPDIPLPTSGSWMRSQDLCACSKLNLKNVEVRCEIRYHQLDDFKTSWKKTKINICCCRDMQLHWHLGHLWPWPRRIAEHIQVTQRLVGDRRLLWELELGSEMQRRECGGHPL